MSVNAVIVAAGEGTRMGGTVPKPFIKMGGHALIVHTLRRFIEARTVGKLIVVTAAKEFERCEELLHSDFAINQRSWILQSGGPTRQASVRKGLQKLDPDCEVVIIHDGVRPFVSADLIDHCVAEARVKGAIVVGTPVRNTIKAVSEDRRVQTTPVRSSLWEAQTPQVFLTPVILDAHIRADREGVEATDDAMLVERLGKDVFVVEGPRTNIKVTVPEDVVFAEALLRNKLVP